MPTTNTHYNSTTGLKTIGFLLPFSYPCTTSTNLSQQALKVSGPCTVTHDTHPLQRSSPTKTRRPIYLFVVLSSFCFIEHISRVWLFFLWNTVYISDFITSEGNLYFTLDPEKRCFALLFINFNDKIFGELWPDLHEGRCVGYVNSFSTRVIFWTVTPSPKRRLYLIYVYKSSRVFML